jgi:hypothetical protein
VFAIERWAAAATLLHEKQTEHVAASQVLRPWRGIEIFRLTVAFCVARFVGPEGVVDELTSHKAITATNCAATSEKNASCSKSNSMRIQHRAS